MLIRDSMIYIVAKLLPGVLGMATTALLTHLLDPRQYGFYGLSLVVMTFGATIVFDWLGVSFMRFYQARKNDPLLVSTVLQLFLALVVITGLLAALAAAFGLVRSGTGLVIMAGLVMMWTFAWFELTSKLEIASFRPMRYLVMNLGRAAASLLGAGIAAWLTRDPVWTAIGTAAGAAAGTLLGGLRGWRLGRRYFDPALAKSILAFGLPLAASNAMSGMISSGTRGLVEVLDSPAALGLYTAAFMMAQNTLAVVGTGIAAAGYSLAVRSVESGDPEAARRQLIANGSLLVAVMAPAALGMALTAGGIARIFVGHAYVPEVTRLMPWIAAGTFFAIIRAHYLDHAFQLGHKSYLQIWVTAAAAIWAVGLCFLLIPRFGPVGAAIALTVAMAFSCLHAAILGRRAFPLPIPWGAMARIVLACAAMAVAVELVPGDQPLNLAFRIAAGGAVYSAAALALNLLDLRSALRQNLARRRQPASALTPSA